jgi:hypothetical protein
MFMIYILTKVYLPICSGSLDNTIRLRAREIFHTATMLVTLLSTKKKKKTYVNCISFQGLTHSI